MEDKKLKKLYEDENKKKFPNMGVNERNAFIHKLGVMTGTFKPDGSLTADGRKQLRERFRREL